MCGKIAYGFWKKRSKALKAKNSAYPENVADGAESVCEAPSTSIHHRSQQLNTSEISLKRILHKELGMMPYIQKMPILTKKKHLFR